MDKKAELSAKKKVEVEEQDKVKGGDLDAKKDSKDEVENVKVVNVEEKRKETSPDKEKFLEKSTFTVPDVIASTKTNLIIENNNHMPSISKPVSTNGGGNLFMNAAKQFSAPSGFGGFGSFGGGGGGFAAAANVEKKGFGYEAEKGSKNKEVDDAKTQEEGNGIKEPEKKDSVMNGGVSDRQVFGVDKEKGALFQGSVGISILRFANNKHETY